MRRIAVLASSLAVFALACGRASSPTPPSLTDPVELAQLVGPEIAPVAGLDPSTRQVGVAFDGTNYLAVWSQLGANGDDIYGALVSASGQLLSTTPFVVASAPGDEQSPAVAFDGTNYLVVWQDHRAGQYMNVYGARVTTSGGVLEPNGFPIDTQIDHQTTPSVAFDGIDYLVVWQDHRAGTNWDVYGARVTTAGTVIEVDGFAISTANSHQTAPAVACGAGECLVAWQDQRYGNDVYGARVTQAGTVSDPAGIAISTAANVQSVPELAFDGTDFVVAWQDLRNGVNADVYAARVSTAGAVLDASGILVAGGTSDQRVPAVAFDGRYVLVAWEAVPVGAPAGVYGARLDTLGTLLDAQPFPIAQPTGGRSLALASDGIGRALAVYDGLDASGVAHARARLVTDWATLTVAKAGSGAGTVASAPAGIDCGATCSAPFDAGVAVRLTATPDADSVFGGWSGACSGTGDCVVTIDQARSVTATFLALYPVTVSFGSATLGTITSSPAGIDCGSACSTRFPDGTVLTLTPTGLPGASVFGSWAGDCSGADACTLVVNGPKAAVATFLPAVTVGLSPSGTGAGTISLGTVTCGTGSACAVDVRTGTTVAITATPDATSILKTWTGCTSSSQTTCTLSVGTYGRTVTAKFEPMSFLVSASPTGSGQGTIDGAGLSCTTGSSAGCSAWVDNIPFSTAYPVVKLRGTPGAASVFKSWSGCIAVSGDPSACTLTVNGAKWLSGKFEPGTLPLTVTFMGSGSGTVSIDNPQLTCASGSACVANVPNPANSAAYTTVTLRAAPTDAGSVFKSWTGCSPVAGDPASCTISVGAAKYVTAKFEPSTLPLNASTTGTGSGTVSGDFGLACTTGSLAGCVAAVTNPPNSATYLTVTLHAAPTDAGSVFKSWTGCTPVAGDPSSCTISVSATKYVSAKFEPSTLPLTASTSGSGSGTVSGDFGLACTTGSLAGCTAAVTNPANSAAYLTVTLHAAPTDAGSVFKSWTGCTPVAGDPASCTIAVSAAKYVSAKFEPSTLPLNVSFAGSGSGTVTIGDLTCSTGSACVADVPNPANSAAYNTVALHAAPADASSVFKGWTGCTAVAGDPTSCTIAVSAAKYVSAKFEPSTLPVTVTGSGGGGGTVTGAGLACTIGVPDGCTTYVANPANTTAYETVTLSASPDASSVFKGWIGCIPVSGVPTSCTVTVSAAKYVTVKLEPSTYVLSVNLSGSGAVSGGPISCSASNPAGCSGPAANGSTVTLSATPDPGYIFKSWSGCTANADGTCNVTMTAAKYVTATFQPATYSLGISFTGTGSGVVTADALTCPSTSGGCTFDEPNGAVVVLSAAADAGSTFTGWAGLCSGTGSCTVTMSTSRYLRASFSSP